MILLFGIDEIALKISLVDELNRKLIKRIKKKII